MSVDSNDVEIVQEEKMKDDFINHFSIFHDNSSLEVTRKIDPA